MQCFLEFVAVFLGFIFQHFGRKMTIVCLTAMAQRAQKCTDVFHALFSGLLTINIFKFKLKIISA
jgi:hypothetical protein